MQDSNYSSDYKITLNTSVITLDYLSFKDLQEEYFYNAHFFLRLQDVYNREKFYSKMFRNPNVKTLIAGACKHSSKVAGFETKIRVTLVIPIIAVLLHNITFKQ